MPEFVRVASTLEIGPGTAKAVEAGGRQLAVFNVGGSFHVIENICKHKGGPLAEGELDGTTVTCPWHGWAYDVSSGECLEDSECSVERFEVKVEGAEIWVKV
jgi:nitrite reductase/ring-hydroxylating ferredoxin subunit